MITVLVEVAAEINTIRPLDVEPDYSVVHYDLKKTTQPTSAGLPVILADICPIAGDFGAMVGHLIGLGNNQACPPPI